MRIAVTYDNSYGDGRIGQHFGHAEYFKFYDAEEGKIVNEQVIATEGQGHGAIAGFLLDNGINAVVCGGIGGGAIRALQGEGIEVYAGYLGHADAAAKACLDGDLDATQMANCGHHGHGGCGGHHHEEGHSCGCEGHHEDGHECGCGCH